MSGRREGDIPSALMSADLERAVLGALLVHSDPDAIIARVAAPDFCVPPYGDLFALVCAMCERGAVVDWLTLAEEAVGHSIPGYDGAPMLRELVAVTPDVAHAFEYADRLADVAGRRALWEASTCIRADVVASMGDDLGALRSRATEVVSTASEGGTEEWDAYSGDAVLAEWLADADRPLVERNHVLPTGLVEVDEMLGGGVRPVDLCVIGARPAIGKTSLALTIMRNVLTPPIERRVLLFSLEMSRKQVFSRLLTLETSIPLATVRAVEPASAWHGALTAQAQRLAAQPWRIYDKPGATLGEIARIARRYHAREPLSLIIVDYLQIVGGDGRPTDNRSREVDLIAWGLKALARTLAVPVIALAQINRGVEQRVDKRPTMADLREAGGIEQAADIIGLLYRDGAYATDDPSKENHAELIVVKQRDGATGTVPLWWEPTLTRFESARTAGCPF